MSAHQNQSGSKNMKAKNQNNVDHSSQEGKDKKQSSQDMFKDKKEKTQIKVYYFVCSLNLNLSFVN